MRKANLLTIFVSIVIAIVFCMPVNSLGRDNFQEPNLDPLPFCIWGECYLDGALLTYGDYTLLAIVDDSIFGTVIPNTSGQFDLDILHDYSITPTVKEGAWQDEDVYILLKNNNAAPGEQLLCAEETIVYDRFGEENMDLHFQSSNIRPNLKICTLIPNPESGNDIVSLYNPTNQSVDLDNWKLRDRDGWEMSLTGMSIGSMSELEIDLGGDILSNTSEGGATAGDEIALCCDNPSSSRVLGDWVAYDLIEYGNQQNTDNTSFIDYPGTPLTGFKIARSPNPFTDTDDCSADFIEEPVPQDISGVYFAKTGPMIDHTPSIIQVDNGTFFMAYEQGTAAWHFTINMMWSPDGISWPMDNIVVSTGGTYGNRHPTLIQRQDGDLQIVYLTDRSGGFEIYTAISSDGVFWTEYGPLTLSGPAINPFIIQEENGNFAMSYQRYGSGSDGSYFATSVDGINWATTGSRVASRSLPRLMKADGGDYLMTFQGGVAGDFEIRYKTSSDGISWGTEQALTNTGNSHDSFPMQLANGSYMIFFCSSIAGGGYDLYRKWSPDMSTWSDDEYLETNNVRFDTEPHACQVSGNGSFLLAWGYESSGAVGAYEDVDIALMWIDDFGLTSRDISLNAGWNLISLPLIPHDTNIESVLSSISGQYNKVMTYDSLYPADPWKRYRPGSASNDLINLDHKKGIWIDVNSPCTLTIYGTLPDITNITLKAGWNLVGYPSTVDKTVAIALAGTGFDRPVEEVDLVSPYLVRQKSNGELMSGENGYWVHVPSDTIWVVDNVPPPPPTPYTIFGFVQLYDGTSAGGYAPMASSGGATLNAEWYNPSIGGWDSMAVPVAPTGQFTADLPNTQDGGIVYLNATFDAPYSNNGYNWTVIDHMMGFSMQNVVCGVPYSVWMMQPVPFQPVMSGVPFMGEYWIVDMDGMQAQGYYTFADGAFEWKSFDALFVSPAPRTFEGTMDMSPGMSIEIMTLFEIGSIYLSVHEGPVVNNYLTSWGKFYIDPENTLPDWEIAVPLDLDYTYLDVI